MYARPRSARDMKCVADEVTDAVDEVILEMSRLPDFKILSKSIQRGLIALARQHQRDFIAEVRAGRKLFDIGSR